MTRRLSFSSFTKALDEGCWTGYKMVGKKMKNGKEVPNCVPEEKEEPNAEPISKDKNKSSSRFWGTRSLANIYKKDTPGQDVKEEVEPAPFKQHKSPEHIAAKHKVPVEQIKKELAMGIEVEKEHTKDPDTARDIALQHLYEKPNYYTLLKRVEKTPVKEAREVPYESGIPKKYKGSLSHSTAKARKAHWDKTSDMPDDDPKAYEPAPGDASAKTKESKYTKRYKEMYGEEVELTFEENAGLRKKADASGISYGTLKKVYNRGVAAWKTGHRPGTTPQQWGMARVNSYITKGKTYHTADKDLHEETADKCAPVGFKKFMSKVKTKNQVTELASPIDVLTGNVPPAGPSAAAKKKRDVILQKKIDKNVTDNAKMGIYSEETLGKIQRTPGGPKKFMVKVRDPKTGNVKTVRFGDPNMEIKRDDPKRRKSFRARHGCGTPRASDRTKAAYWSCRQWRAGAKVES